MITPWRVPDHWNQDLTGEQFHGCTLPISPSYPPGNDIYTWGLPAVVITRLFGCLDHICDVPGGGQSEKDSHPLWGLRPTSRADSGLFTCPLELIRASYLSLAETTLCLHQFDDLEFLKVDLEVLIRVLVDLLWTPRPSVNLHPDPVNQTSFDHLFHQWESLRSEKGSIRWPLYPPHHRIETRPGIIS